jgi:hypothetical protein
LDEREGFPRAEDEKRQSLRRDFIEVVSRLLASPAVPYHLAKHITECRNLLFQPNDRALVSLEPFFQEMARYAAGQDDDDARRLEYESKLHEKNNAERILQLKNKISKAEKQHWEAMKDGNTDLVKQTEIEIKALEAQVRRAAQKKMTLAQKHALGRSLRSVALKAKSRKHS